MVTRVTKGDMVTRGTKAVLRLQTNRFQCGHVTLVTLLTLLTFPGPAMTRDLEGSRQCVVVLTDDWGSTNGSMRRFERDNSTANWKEKGHLVPVVVGKNGLGQGI